MLIYKAVNKIDKKIYIGKTIKTLKQRKACHISYSKKDNPNQYFHRALKKYGIENFKWFIIEECETEKELNEKELYYIDKYKSHVSFGIGYNMTFGGEGSNGNDFSGKNNPNYGKKMSDIQKKKISKSRKGKCLGKDNPNYGNPLNRSGKNHPMYGKHHTEKTKIKLRKNKGDRSKLSKKYIITYPNGKEETIIGLREFCRQHPELTRQSLYGCAQGRYKQHKKYKCKYKETD